MSSGFCNKFHTLSSSAKILKIGDDLTKLHRQLKGGNFFERQCTYVVLQYSLTKIK